MVDQTMEGVMVLKARGDEASSVRFGSTSASEASQAKATSW